MPRELREGSLGKYVDKRVRVNRETGCIRIEDGQPVFYPVRSALEPAHVNVGDRFEYDKPKRPPEEGFRTHYFEIVEDPPEDSGK
ncbi:MAG: hypothetical protein V3V26_00505 [Candidatus Aenigmarchaeota archaeon]